MTASPLVPVIPGTIGNVQCLTVDGRALHRVLGVRRVFAAWIQGRINKYGFVQGHDFEVFSNSGKNTEGGRPSQEYRCSLDMGKELCMVENNEKGRIARRYFIECERRLLATEQIILTPEPSRISKRTDPERKQLTAIINAWVGMAPIHYASARTQVNAHFGVTSVDQLTVGQVKEAIAWVQGKIDALPPAPQKELPPATEIEKDKFEAYMDEVEAFRARTTADLRRLLDEGLNLVVIQNLGVSGIVGFTNIFQHWLEQVAVTPVPLMASWQGVDRAIDFSPLCLIKRFASILEEREK